jgi:D-alanyl-lipoteichoic acid acyltransferase DltB (MBOAT superfamily)
VIVNIGVLSVLKYGNFFLENVYAVLAFFGIKATRPVLDIVLPLGISFYTFQSISYIVDVYRGAFESRKRFHEFVASLTFFPHLVAGPIVRSSKLLPQFEHIKPPEWTSITRGLTLLALGLSKKTIADLLAPVAEGIFWDSGAGASPLDCWVGVLAFTAQIYGDFAGYTDIAIGISLLLGFSLPPNFELPYLARSPVDFWKRWHISLSSWLHDYLYLPIARSSRSAYFSLFITWLLAGLWHGARWNFVAYGLFHAILLMATTWLSRNSPDWMREWEDGRTFTFLATAFTFYLMTIGFVLFRAPTLVDAWKLVGSMHVAQVPVEWSFDSLSDLALVVAALVSCHLMDYFTVRKPKVFDRPYVLWPTVIASFAFTLAFGPAAAPFIYFQF